MKNELYEVKVININKDRKYLVVADNIQVALNLIFTKELKSDLYNPDDPSYELKASSIDLDDVASPTILAKNGILEEE